METSALWSRTLGSGDNDRSVHRLVESLRSVRRRADHLTRCIASALPGLTIHDVSHLDALWDVADTIAGDEFPLNPLEAYVFGCAVCLHDSGLCFEAYKGGLAAVRKTVHRRDAKQRLESSGHSEDVDRDADFEALRSLHAAQAAHLATSPWQDEHGSREYMIDDSELRDHYGAVIGQIAGQDDSAPPNGHDSNVHVSDVAALVSSLGGENLYGKDVDRFEVALRELVQNAADAIVGRRAIDESYERGQITVRLMARSGAAAIVQVDDDGTGMSQRTLTRDMLDFGSSFWSSERAAKEFPGLHSSGYASIGRFGTGFFSVFMAASKVRVFSRRFDAGINDVRLLSFDKGVSLRPVLSDNRPVDMRMNITTRIELELKPGVLDDPSRVPVRTNEPHQPQLLVPLGDYVAALVSGLDVPVNVEIAGKPTRVHDCFPPLPERREQWLRTISYVSAGVNPKSLGLVCSAAPRLREIRDEEGCYGLAAIGVSRPPLGLTSRRVGATRRLSRRWRLRLLRRGRGRWRRGRDRGGR